MGTDVKANSWLQRTKPSMKMAPLPGFTGFEILNFEAVVQSWRVACDVALANKVLCASVAFINIRYSGSMSRLGPFGNCFHNNKTTDIGILEH